MTTVKQILKQQSTDKVSSGTNGWDDAIADAERNIDRLKTAIIVFERNKANGEPWPTQN